MKKLLITISTLMITLTAPLAIGASAGAVNLFNNCGQGDAAIGQPVACQDAQQATKSGQNPIINTLKLAINILSFAIGIASVIMIIISGLRMVLSGGDVKAAEEARSGVIYAIIGILITIVAQVIVRFVLDQLP